MNHQIYEEAANWLVELRTGESDAGQRRKFDRWVRKSPEHLRAYLEIVEIWDDASLIDVANVPSRAQIVAAAKSDEATVIANAFPSASEHELVAGRSTGRGLSLRWLTVAASILLATLAFGAYIGIQRDTYEAATGEQRSIILSDGSTIQLNSQSRVRVRYAHDARYVELMQGQALFRVAKDPDRPFRVRTDDTEVRALGTQFDVYRKPSGTVVTVVEGTVAVFSRAEGDSKIFPLANPAMQSDVVLDVLLTAGDQVTLSESAAPRVEKDRASSATAWTQYQMVFKATPLPDVVEEFNRYNTRPLILEGGDLSDFRISGVYSSTDSQLLVRFLREQPGLLVRETEGAIFIVALEAGRR